MNFLKEPPRLFLLLAIVLTTLVFAWAILWRNSSLLTRTWSRGDRHGRRVALTFDDGPDPRLTPLVLDLLDRQRIKATFFCIGERARRHPELVREIDRRGHQLANHSFEHTWRMNFWPPVRVAKSMVRGGRALARATGAFPRGYRAPVGIKSPAQALMSWRLGLDCVGWTRSAGDGGRRVLRPAALARLAAAARPGDIILLHDGKPAQADEGLIASTRDTFGRHLPQMIDALRARGLEPVRLDALLGRSAVRDPRAARHGNDTLPASRRGGLRAIIRHLLTEQTSPRRLALALALGVAVGSSPFFGLHTLISLVLAARLRLNKMAAFLGSNITNPLTGPFIVFANIQAGHWLLHGRWLTSLPLHAHPRVLWTLGNHLLLCWIVGYPLAGGLAAAFTLVIAYPIISLLRQRP